MASHFSNEAVVFMDGPAVAKEMLYPEFEAILDHVVAIDEFKATQVPAVYLRINNNLQIGAAVFFYLVFDANGYADPNWNLPLQHLAEQAGPGPDLGAGAIKLTCRSQCSVSWHQRSLWDPLGEGEEGQVAGTFQKLAAHIKKNRLAFEVDIPPKLEPVRQPEKNHKPITDPQKPVQDVAAIEQQIKQSLQKKSEAKIAALAQEHKLRIDSIKTEAKSILESHQRRYQGEMAKLNETLEATKQLFLEEKHNNLQLRELQKKHAEDLQLAREEFQQQAIDNKELAADHSRELEQRFALELEAKLEQATSELKQMLEMREVELYYRDEQVKRLNDEIAQLRQQKQNMVSGGDRLLQTMTENGVSFIAYQIGLDQLTLTKDEVSQYLEAPLSFYAEKTGLDIAHYELWLTHYHKPCCSHINDQGKACEVSIPRVDKPSRFVGGENDRCVEHSRSATALSELLKVREPTS